MSDDTLSAEVEEFPPIEDGVGAATHMFLWLCIIVVAAFGYWAWQGKLAVVSVATGEVVPATQIKTIQHLEGGIVREIRIKEGDNVKAGQALIVLESTSSGADVSELKTRIAGLRVQMVRLEGEARRQSKLKFPPELTKSNPSLVREARQLFTSKRASLSDKISGQKAIIAQRQQDILEITARLRNQNASLKLLNEQIAIGEDLLRDNLTNRYRHLDLLKERERLRGGIGGDKVAVLRARSALSQARSVMAGVTNTYTEEARSKLASVRRQYEEFTPRLAKFEDSLKRTVLRSPVAGVVKTLHVVTIGGVVRAGDKIIDIVPAGDQLVIEAKLPTQDIGYVRAGQPAFIKLASSDAMRFDNLLGEVVSVSPDTLIAEDGIPYYKVRIETERDHFLRGVIRYDLFPGMQVLTSIHTGERTVLEYIIDPFLNARDSALRER